jgi:prepilin-type N-terminal cleavage/methylation domain-containing protein
MRPVRLERPERGSIVVQRRSQREQAAFTLIELLVVVSIIALLISILLPSLRNAREQAKLVRCLAHMRGAGQAARVFAAERKDHFQLASDEVGIAAADPYRQKFAYGAEQELLSWPVALAQAGGVAYSNNWDWGVRAVNYEDARQKAAFIKDDLEIVTCPADRVRIATPYYPRNKSLTLGGIDNDGLKGAGDPSNPIPGSEGMSYWGYLSYGINEDVVGAEVAESAGRPACWRAVQGDGGWVGCRGEYGYPGSHPCGRDQKGWRLRGNLDRIHRPGDVALLVEAGRDDDSQPAEGFANLIISAQANGPYLGDFQQRHSTRLPSKRHPEGRLNVLYTDLHGGTARPVRFENGLPSEYTPRVRVSPYEPHETED